jgi:hypothetical protein
LVLFAKSPASGAAAYDALLAAAREGRLERAGLEESYARIQAVQAGAAG